MGVKVEGPPGSTFPLLNTARAAADAAGVKIFSRRAVEILFDIPAGIRSRCGP